MRIICIILVIAFFSGWTTAQVTVKLRQPPPNQLRSTDIWNVSLTNTTRSSIVVILSGTLEEGSAGIIVDGTSKPFTLQPGTKTITYDDVKSGSVNFKSGKWREAFTRTGNAPSGDYTICIYVKDESGEELGTDCVYQTVEISGPPELISPPDGEEITTGALPTFTWLPPMPIPPGANYKIKIVEIIGNQSPEEAMLRNKAFFEKEDIRMTMFQYPVSAPKLRDGKKYVWVINAGDLQSNLSIFEEGSDSIDVESKFDPQPTDSTEQRSNRWGNIYNQIECDVYKVEFRKITQQEIISYNLLITNDYRGELPGNKPASFRIKVKGDSIVSINATATQSGVVLGTSQWERTPSKFPPGSGGANWKSTSGDIPIGTADLGAIVFQQNSSKPIVVEYEWSDKEGAVICRGSYTIRKKIAFNWKTDYHVERTDILKYLNTKELIIKKGEYLYDYSTNPHGDIILPLAIPISDNGIEKKEIMFEVDCSDETCKQDGETCMGNPGIRENPSYCVIKRIIENGMVTKIILSY